MDGLKNVHDRGLAHRDLKMENVLLSGDHVLKIADFGFAAPMAGPNGDGFMRTKLGTRTYMAPEIHLRKPYKGDLVDLFASAIILFTMVCKHPPFTEARPQDPFYKVVGGGKYDIFWQAHERGKPKGFFSDDFKNLISRMIALDPSNRLTMDQVRSHPWYTNPDVPKEADVR